MALLTSKDVTNWYLYEQKDTPANLIDERLIRPENITIDLSIDTEAYMTEGGGRFALGSEFELIQNFFEENNVPPLPEEKEFYTKEDIAGFYGLDPFGLVFRQLDIQDEKNDYGERTYIFNSSAFKISDNVRFYVNSEGQKWIENFSIRPWDEIEDNFDFEGGGIITGATNFFLEPEIDPSGIGRTVVFKYDSGTSPLYEVYDQFSYEQEQQIAESWDGLTITLDSEIDAIVKNLYAEGTIRFVDDQNRPIFYGTLGNDGINRFDYDNPLLNPELPRAVENGVTVIAGAGKDNVFGTDKPDDIYAGTDADIDVLKGKAGNDTYSIHPNDIIIDDTIEDINFSPATILQDITPEEFKLNQLLIDGETQTAGDPSNYTLTPDISTQLAPLNFFSEKSSGEKLEFKWFVDGVENYFPIMHDPAKDITYYRFLEGTVVEYGNGTDTPDRVYLAREDGAAPTSGDFGITYEYYAMPDSFTITEIPENNFYINDDSTWIEIANLVFSPEWVAEYTEPIYQELLTALENAEIDEEELEDEGNSIGSELTPEEAEIARKEAAPSADPTDGNDILTGTEGNDFIVGSIGDDFGSGGAGNDEYFWEDKPGNNSFTLDDSAGELDIVNIIDTDLNQLAITRSGNDIQLGLGGGSTVTLVNQATESSFEVVRFDYETVFTPENLLDAVDTI